MGSMMVVGGAIFGSLPTAVYETTTAGTSLVTKLGLAAGTTAGSELINLNTTQPPQHISLTSLVQHNASESGSARPGPTNQKTISFSCVQHILRHALCCICCARYI
ncbi:hypothetical protein AA313_de0207443 [Arthrobotrys entomopaga]|nr:hypothetical protein AA313_de0207443 [Arthrobotrys entomopaga]